MAENLITVWNVRDKDKLDMSAGILVISDDHNLRGRVDDLLVGVSLNITHSESIAGVARLLHDYPSPKLVILDLALRDGRAWELLSLFRRTDKLRRMPVLVLTALPEPDQISHAFKMGADRYLTKVFIDKNLIDTVRSMVSQD